MAGIGGTLLVPENNRIEANLIPKYLTSDKFGLIYWRATGNIYHFLVHVGFRPIFFTLLIPNRDRSKAFANEHTHTCSIITYKLNNIAYNCVFYQVVVSIPRCNGVGTYSTVIWSNFAVKSIVVSHGIKWRVALGQEFQKVWINR